MAKKPLLNTCGDIQLSYSLAHPEIPAPTLGFRPDWASLHAHIPNLGMDHSSCPGIQAREQIGITLFMPYTIRFFREGKIEIDAFWDKSDKKPFLIQPIQSTVPIAQGQEEFPGFITQLPSKNLNWPLHIFMLGDLRAQAWIIQSGVKINENSQDYTLLMLNLPNHPYGPGYSVGQSMVHSFPNIAGQLKICVDIDFRNLPKKTEAVEIIKGTPMIQYIPMKIPRVLLQPALSKDPNG